MEEIEGQEELEFLSSVKDQIDSSQFEPNYEKILLKELMKRLKKSEGRRIHLKSEVKSIAKLTQEKQKNIGHLKDKLKTKKENYQKNKEETKKIIISQGQVKLNDVMTRYRLCKIQEGLASSNFYIRKNFEQTQTIISNQDQPPLKQQIGPDRYQQTIQPSFPKIESGPSNFLAKSQENKLEQKSIPKFLTLQPAMSANPEQFMQAKMQEIEELKEEDYLTSAKSSFIQEQNIYRSNSSLPCFQLGKQQDLKFIEKVLFRFKKQSPPKGIVQDSGQYLDKTFRKPIEDSFWKEDNDQKIKRKPVYQEREERKIELPEQKYGLVYQNGFYNNMDSAIIENPNYLDSVFTGPQENSTDSIKTTNNTLSNSDISHSTLKQSSFQLAQEESINLGLNESSSQIHSESTILDQSKSFAQFSQNDISRMDQCEGPKQDDEDDQNSQSEQESDQESEAIFEKYLTEKNFQLLRNGGCQVTQLLTDTIFRLMSENKDSLELVEYQIRPQDELGLYFHKEINQQKLWIFIKEGTTSNSISQEQIDELEREKACKVLKGPEYYEGS